MPSIKKIRDKIFLELSSYYEPEERTSISLILLESLLQKRRSQLLSNPNEEIPQKVLDEIEKALARLLKWEPLQYVLGEAYFFGRKYFVDQSVLIPRPETEELVAAVIRECGKNDRILDIGTGSGTIAITLSLEVKGSEVFGIDNSAEALAIAGKNADRHFAKVQFLHTDFLLETPGLGKFDIIVSNPPYIPVSEISQMKSNVSDFEPADALFVPDDDPLLFYKRMITVKEELIRPGGKLFVEIHERFGREVKELFESSGAKSVMVIKDLNEKDRIVRAEF